jgi:hypothetical protein
MDGVYFFGENLRWNLGWGNPNQAGVFVAMLIPWLWGLAALARRGFRGASLVAAVLLATELVLWFLLCKTYSRGALMAVGGAGVVYLGGACLMRQTWLSWKSVALRAGAVAVLLIATGFFARIDPRFVSTDASAGNRLVLWKGGLQMIAVSPWQGWGKGQSGNGFMHWFQPLEAKERYAGMVNSYLHVAVEYGLPVFVGVMTVAVGLLVFSLWGGCGSFWEKRLKNSIQRETATTWWARSVMAGAGCSLLVFLAGNFFSTLWIFKNLWWVPTLDAVVIVAGGVFVLRRKFFKAMGMTLAAGFAMSVMASLAIFIAGSKIKSEPQISLDPTRRIVIANGAAAGRRAILFLPDASVLGQDWGKEIRRLAAAPRFRDYSIETALKNSREKMALPSSRPDIIIACGSQFPCGFTTWKKFSNAHLILVHPTGKPDAPEGFDGSVSLILPMLDTTGNARRWKAMAKREGWKISISPGVGQDVRLVWPDVLVIDREAELQQTETNH